MKIIAEKNKILEFISGSHLYGTNTPTSDKDFMGIFVAPKEFYLGLNKVEEVDFSIVSKSADGKNDENAVDKKFYELRKFIKLAADGNPNIIESIFVNENNILYQNDLGRKLLVNTQLFPSKLVKQKFIGYAVSQMKKASVKPDNFLDLQTFKDRYTSELDKKRLVEMLYIDSPIVSLIKFSKDFASIGGLNFNLNVKMTNVYDSITTRLGKASHRQDMWLKYGCDTKFLMHTIRLLIEGKELLETGEIIFPLKEKDILLKIRNGELDLKEIHEMTEHYKNELENYESSLPNTPDFKLIENLLIEMVEESWKNGAN